MKACKDGGKLEFQDLRDFSGSLLGKPALVAVFDSLLLRISQGAYNKSCWNLKVLQLLFGQKLKFVYKKNFKL